MSDHSTANASDEAHTGPIKNPKQLLTAVAFSFILPVFIIIGLVYVVTSGNKSGAGAVDPERA
ncbi:MAG: cytochrome c5 family protein, partial [Rhodoferax sp.]|nr:cytochrome c5 family protein [Rhodoferax sp.]